MHWKHWSYWLRGGLVAGGIALAYLLLLYSCGAANSFLHGGPEDWGFSMLCMGLFGELGPTMPTVWFLSALQPILHFSDALIEVYAPALSVLVFFVVGTVIGAFLGLLKRIRNG